MRIKMLTMAAGPEGVWLPGSVMTVTADEARALVTGGYAVALEPTPVVPPLPAQATAAVDVPETPERAVPKRHKG